MSKVDPCLFMSKTVICVVYVDDCLFWACSQSEIKNVMNSLRLVPVIIGKTQRENQCLSSSALISRHSIMVDFSFVKMD